MVNSTAAQRKKDGAELRQRRLFGQTPHNQQRNFYYQASEHVVRCAWSTAKNTRCH
jgi:hypothetical protein